MRTLIMTFIFLWINALAITSVSAQTNESIDSFTNEIREEILQNALNLRKEGNYTQAVEKLDEILSQKTADAPILLLKGDLLLQSKKFADAAKTYEQLLTLNYETTTTQINLSYALFMSHKTSKALQFAEAAWEGNKSNANTVVNKFNALLWNIKTKKAAEFLAEQESILAEDQVEVMKARLYTTSGNYKQGLTHYKNLVTKYPDKNYIQEYAEVLIGKKEITTSLNLIRDSKDLFSSKEYLFLEQKTTPTQLQNAGTEFVYFKDIAQNRRIESSVWWQQKEDTKYRIGVRAGLSNITSPQQIEVNSKFVGLTINERWNLSWNGQTDITTQNISSNEGNRYTAINGKQSVKYQPNDRHMLGFFLSTDVLNFTASLLEKNIRSYNLGYLTHIMLDGKNGFYSQGSVGSISDENKRMEIFGSFYHLFSTVPLVKAGVNFSGLHFKDNNITAYFSPEKYLSTELFVDYNTTIPKLSKLFLQTQIAGGLQKIEQGKWETAFRLQSELSLKMQHFDTSLKYQTSNIASNVGTGYKFNWLTMKLVYKW